LETGESKGGVLKIVMRIRRRVLTIVTAGVVFILCQG
jgi:hypothetical protein